MFSGLAFSAPLVLWALLALPVLWFLLRAVPPAPVLRRFPGVGLLLGLEDESRQAARTPWWLLALRMLALGAVIVGFAGPVLNPRADAGGTGPLLVVMDASWADAGDWAARVARAEEIGTAAAREGRAFALLRASEAARDLRFDPAEAVLPALRLSLPAPWAGEDLGAWIAHLPEGGFDTVWLTDGLATPGKDALASALAARGRLSVVESAAPVAVLEPAVFENERVVTVLRRLRAALPARFEVEAYGLDPAGQERVLARQAVDLGAGVAQAEVGFDLPPELRNRVTRFQIAHLASVGAVVLSDDSLRRRKVALISASAQAETLQLLSPLHYLRQALAPSTDLIEAPLTAALAAAPDVVVLADVARLGPAEATALTAWVEGGGLLLRFAGPRLAAAQTGALEADPLLPVRLREGGRALGGALSWGEARGLAPFAEDSPFFGLVAPADVEVRQSVLAIPDPDLAGHTIAALSDGTPLVTRKAMGAGQVLLFHITANADWSNLPLSGLFVEMLSRLSVLTRPDLGHDTDLAGQIWVPETALDAFGRRAAMGERGGVAGADLATALAEGPRSALPPGLYTGRDRAVALNIGRKDMVLAAMVWPAGARVEALSQTPPVALTALCLILGFAAFALDALAALAVQGKLRLWGGARGGGVAAVLAVVLTLGPDLARAETAPVGGDDDFALAATLGVVLAYVKTGDAEVDGVSEAAMLGLSEALRARSAVEPELPMGVDLEADELAFFPFLYWPVLADAAPPSDAAYVKLNQFLRSGGMILFDTRDAGLGAVGTTSPEARALQELAAKLDIPPLAPVPRDHILTRTFYLLEDFPGRWTGGTVWAEAVVSRENADGYDDDVADLTTLNDGVTPVIIGGHDWAGAWAHDEYGTPLRPVGRGSAGERQREMALRFGVNVIMLVLTGNYKSDQVHVPALLERLGQ